MGWSGALRRLWRNCSACSGLAWHNSCGAPNGARWLASTASRGAKQHGATGDGETAATTSDSFYPHLPRISQPVRLVQKLRAQQEHAAHERLVAQLRGARRPVVLCKRRELNFYAGDKFDALRPQLASSGWKHRQAAGDWFTICARDGRALAGGPPLVQLGLCDELVRLLGEQGVVKATAVQELAIPQLLAGRCALVTAETGSGKTLAYMAPLLQRLMAARSGTSAAPPHQPRILVLVPSQELVLQVFHVVRPLAHALALRAFPLLQAGKLGQNKKLTGVYAADIIVATPGKFRSCIEKTHLDLSCFRFLVLDEVDSLLDDSFSPVISSIMQRLNTAERISAMSDAPDETLAGCGQHVFQCVMVGATVPRDVENILAQHIDMSQVVRLKTSGAHRIPTHVTQRFLRTGLDERPARLLEIVQQALARHRSTLVFCNRTGTVYFVYRWLCEQLARPRGAAAPAASPPGAADHSPSHESAPQPSSSQHLQSDAPLAKCHPAVGWLHKGLSPDERSEQMRRFADGQTLVLVATDLASRGLDTTHVQQVVNFEMPGFTSDYLHRAGRVGRVGGATGAVVTFVARPWDVPLVCNIEVAARHHSELFNVNANIKRKLRSLAAPQRDPPDGYDEPPAEVDSPSVAS